MADNNKVIITYRYSTFSRYSYDARRAYSDGYTVYTGHREDALEYFRNLHPSKSIIFQQKDQQRCY